MKSGTSIVQNDATKLKSTVTQAEKDRTVTNDNYANFLATVKVSETTSTPSSSFDAEQKTVAVPGTAEALASSTPCIAVSVKALAANVGKVYVGNSSLNQNQYELNAKEEISLGIDNLNLVYVDADNAGEGVCYAYLT